MNDVKLQEGHPVDENLRPLKVGGKSTALEVSKEDVRVNNLYVKGTTVGVSATDETKLPLSGGTMTGQLDFEADLEIQTAGDFKLDIGGDLEIDVAGNDVNFTAAGAKFAAIGNSGTRNFTLYEASGGTDDYCKISTTSSGITTIATVDAAADNAHFTLDIDGNILLRPTPAGHITLQENDGTVWTPSLGSDATTKTYVDDSHFLKQVEVTISEAEMDALHTTEKVLVAAQGANMVVVPVSLIAFVNRDASTTQAATNDLRFGVSGGTTLGEVWYSYRRFMWNEGGDRLLNISAFGALEVSQALDNFDNRPLTAKMSGAITSGSLESVKLNLTYYVYDNS